MAKYDPLERYLRRKGAGELVMNFADIERVIGAMLPKSASLAAWWANEKASDTRHVQCRAWLDAGYEAALMREGDKVRFTRRRRG